VGGLLAKATGGDFKTGALAAGANEALVGTLDKLVGGNESLLTMSSQIVGVLAAAAQSDADSEKIQTGAWVAKNATQYNSLNHREVKQLAEEARSCEAAGNCAAVKEKFRKLSVDNQDKLFADCGAGNASGCLAAHREILEDRLKILDQLSKMSVDGSIPSTFKADLGNYVYQNMSEVAILRQAEAELALQSQGVSVERAQQLSEITGVAAAAFLGVKKSTASTGSVGGLFGNKPKKNSLPSVQDTPEGKSTQQVGASPPNLAPEGAGRSGAFNEAKRRSGIPTSQQPSKISPNYDKRGNPQPGTMYEFELPAPGGGTKIVRIRDDAGGHDYGPGNAQNRGAHFNDEAGNHYDY